MGHYDFTHFSVKLAAPPVISEENNHMGQVDFRLSFSFCGFGLSFIYLHLVDV